MNSANFSFMVDFLNSNRNRKIDILRSEIESVNGMRQSELSFTVNKVTQHFQESVSRYNSKHFNLERFQNNSQNHPIKNGDYL